MKKNYLIGLLAALLVGLVAGWALASKKNHVTAVSQVSTAQDQAMLELDGKTIMNSDLPEDLRNSILENKKIAREQNERALQEFALRYSLAKSKDSAIKNNLMPPLLELLNLPQPSEQDIKKYFDANKARLASGVRYDQIKNQLSDYIVRQKSRDAITENVKKMQDSGRLKILLDDWK